MTYVITRACCSDASCVPTCPVDCIHPAPGEPGYATAEMLYIDPETCIECSACVQVCPVNAIMAEEDLTPSTLPYLEMNAAYYELNPLDSFAAAGAEGHVTAPALAGLRVAIVGSGPAGSYAAAELLGHRGVEIDVYERLLTPLGLVRFGVAPDHQTTKAISAIFPYQGQRPGLTLHLGVEVGRDITHAELLQHHHAVIYAVGAAGDRPLGVPGEDLPGSHPATEFVAWYNGHPEAAERTFDLSGERVVVIGNGNVALDVARILASDPDELAATDIADHALAALRESKAREVVVVGRRGPAHAAYTTSELLDLTCRSDFDVVTLANEVGVGVGVDEAVDPRVRMKVRIAQELAVASPAAAGPRRRIVLRYLHSPVALVGGGRVEGVRLVRNEIVAGPDGRPRARPTGAESQLAAGLVLRSVGYRGQPVAGLPFDPETGTVPSARGRVLGGDVPAAYVTGWIKRGPTGVIGANKHCAAETVASLVEDVLAGRLGSPTRDRASLEALLATRVGERRGLADWARIDAAERKLGRQSGRPRVKIARTAQLLAAAGPGGQDAG